MNDATIVMEGTKKTYDKSVGNIVAIWWKFTINVIFLARWKKIEYCVCYCFMWLKSSIGKQFNYELSIFCASLQIWIWNLKAHKLGNCWKVIKTWNALLEDKQFIGYENVCQ